MGRQLLQSPRFTISQTLNRMEQNQSFRSLLAQSDSLPSLSQPRDVQRQLKRLDRPIHRKARPSTQKSRRRRRSPRNFPACSPAKHPGTESQTRYRGPIDCESGSGDRQLPAYEDEDGVVWTVSGVEDVAFSFRVAGCKNA